MSERIDTIPDRVDLVVQYALAVAAQNDFGERELGPIHLLKYVYLGDLAHAARNGGKTFTNAPWRFYKFGPWSNDVHERIRPAVGRVHATERTFGYQNDSGEDGEGIRWRLAEQDDQLIAEIERKIPGVLSTAVRRYVRDFGSNTSDLLHFVYRTEPMLRAIPNEPLSFAYAVPEPMPQFSPVEELSERQRKKLRASMQALKERLAGQARPRYIKANPAPIYDEIFEAGVKSLDHDAGSELVTTNGEVKFMDEMWAARRGHDGGTQ